MHGVEDLVYSGCFGKYSAVLSAAKTSAEIAGMELIREWLNGKRNYAKGVALYMRYGKDDVLRSLFNNEGETQFKRERLLQALKELWNDQKNSFTPISEELPEKKETAKASESDRWAKAYTDPVLSTLKDKWQAAYSEMKMLQHRLLDITMQAERCASAHKILDLDDLCDEFYVKRDYYVEHGKLPEDTEPELVGDPVKWPVKLANAKRYIREYKRKLKKDPDNVRFVAKMKQYEDEVVFYEEKLKMYVD